MEKVKNLINEYFPPGNTHTEKLINFIRLYVMILFKFCNRLLFIFYEYVFEPLIRIEKSVKKEIILITGSGGYLGRRLAHEFARRGATLILLDINEEANKRTYENAKLVATKDIHLFKVDLTNEDQTRNTAKQIRDKIGDVTMLIMAAAPPFEPKSVLDMNYNDDISKQFLIGYMAQLWLIQEFSKSMIAKNHGHIATISSSSSYCDTPLIAHYSSFKLAQAKLLETFREELAVNKIHGVKTTVVFMNLLDGGLATGFKDSIIFKNTSITAEYAAECITSGILKNRTIIFVPRVHRYFYCLKYLYSPTLLGKVVQYYSQMNPKYFQLKSKFN